MAAELASGSLETDWRELSAKLPSGSTAAERAARAKIWRDMDINGNGYCSLAEIDKGVLSVLQLENVHGAKPVLIRAFEASKGSARTKSALGEDYVEKGKEFRVLLGNLRMYFELYAMFARVDTTDDRRVDFDEFVRALPLLESWGVTIDDPRAEFDLVDRGGGGMLLFDEFCRWAMSKQLDLPDDDDNEAPAEPRPASPRRRKPRSSPRSTSRPSSPRRAASPARVASPRAASPPPLRGHDAAAAEAAASLGGAQVDDSFGLDAQLVERLLGRSKPLPPGRRYRPSRRLLLLVHAAVHGGANGSGAPLVTPSLGRSAGGGSRERVAHELWLKLTGDERSCPHELHAEALLSARKAIPRAPSPATRRWLDAAPAALLRKVPGAGAGFGSTGLRLVHPGVRVPNGGGDDRLLTPAPDAYCGAGSSEMGTASSRAASRSASFGGKSFRSTQAVTFRDRCLPWERGAHGSPLDTGGPPVGARKSGLSRFDVGSVASGRPSPAFSSTTVAHASKVDAPSGGAVGPGTYETTRDDMGHLRDAARPSASFAKGGGRGSLFGASGSGPAGPLRAQAHALNGSPTPSSCRAAAGPLRGRARSAPPGRAARE